MYFKNSLFFVISFCGFLILGLLFLPESTNNADLEENIFIEKTNNPRPVDIIALGDSRVNKGLNTTILKERLGLVSSINLGYSSGGLGNVLFDIANQYIKSNSILLLGITEMTFTPNAHKNLHINSFFGKKKKLILSKKIQARSLNTIKSQLIGVQIVSKPQNDGYIIVQDVFRSEYEYLDEIENLYFNNKVDTNHINTCILQIQKWQSQGNTVVCYVPPVPDTIRKAEIQFGGINVAEYLKSKGISVLEFEYEGNFYTYDGSHLNDTSGLKLSKWIAKEIKTLHK